LCCTNHDSGKLGSEAENCGGCTLRCDYVIRGSRQFQRSYRSGILCLKLWGERREARAELFRTLRNDWLAFHLVDSTSIHKRLARCRSRINRYENPLVRLRLLCRAASKSTYQHRYDKQHAKSSHSASPTREARAD